MSWDKTKPQENSAINTGPAVIQANNAAIEAAIDQDHDFGTGSSQTGKHNKVTLIETANLGTGAEGLPILGAQTAGGKAELVFTDEDDNDVQITAGGKIKSASLDMKDEDNMVSDSASHAASQQSIKAYADTEAAAAQSGAEATAAAALEAAETALEEYADAAPAAQMSPSSLSFGDNPSEQSITYPNGLIVKFGYIPKAGVPTAVSFGTAFPNSAPIVLMTPVHTTTVTFHGNVTLATKSGFNINDSDQNVTGYFWQAWGR